MTDAPFQLQPLLAAVRERSTGLGSSVHGDVHWRTVGANGLWIAEFGAEVDRVVVFLFALLHDSMRQNDHVDPEHGPRAALLARELRAEGTIGISDEQLALLVFACDEHTNGYVTPDPTVGACWDADRLDLPRVGATVLRDLLSTPVGRDGRPPLPPPPSWEELYGAAGLRESAPT